MKLKRSAHRFFLNVKGDTPEWYWVGKDIDDMSVEMNGSFETKKNIMDESSVTDTGYNPSVSATPYFADPDDAIYAFLEDIAMNRKSGDDCKAECLEVIVKEHGKKIAKLKLYHMAVLLMVTKLNSMCIHPATE